MRHFLETLTIPAVFWRIRRTFTASHFKEI